MARTSGVGLSTVEGFLRICGDILVREFYFFELSRCVEHISLVPIHTIYARKMPQHRPSLSTFWGEKATEYLLQTVY